MKILNKTKQILLFVIFLTTNLVAQSPSPGGKSDDLKFWVKSDVGVTGTSSVTQWNDQSANSFNLTTTATPSKIDNSVNFNPAISFNGTSQYMQVTGGIMGTSTYNDIWVYLVQNTRTISNSFVFSEKLTGSNGRLAAHLPWTDNNIYYDFGSCCSSSRINTNWGTSSGVFNLWTLASSTGLSTPTGSRKNISRDGLSLITNNNNSGTDRTGAGNNFYIATTDGSSLFHAGDIAEIIIYQDVPTTLEQQRIQSYLAIKYGITLNSNDDIATITEGDYILSDGSTKAWNFATNSSYHNDVSGIGRDDNSGLHQKQSKSVNLDAMVTIGLGTIATTNSANTNTFSSDKNTLMWGNDNGSLVLQTTELPTTATASQRLGREWKVSENGTVNNLTISFSGIPAAATNLELYVDTDGDADFSNASIISGGVLTAGTVTFTGVDLNNNNLFTLGYTVPNKVQGYLGPGGVGNTNGTSSLTAWYYPNNMRNASNVLPSDGNTVSTWLDASGHNNTATNSGTATYEDDVVNAVNGNPTLLATALSRQFVTAKAFTGKTIFAVNNSDTRNSFEGLLGFDGDKGIRRPFTADNIWQSPADSSTDVWSSTTGFSYVNGSTTNTGTHGNTLHIINQIRPNTYTNNFYLGGYFSGRSFTGSISEVIVYDTDLNLAQKIIVDNYLSAKYNIALVANDFYNEDTTSGDFDYDVAGIGQATDGSNHTDSQGTGIIRINTPSALTNDTYLFWGRNNQTPYTFSTTTNYRERISSSWRVSKRNNLGTVTVEVDMAGIDVTGKQSCAPLQLIVDNDSNLETPTNTYTLTNISGTIYRATGVNFADNDYFTIQYIDEIVVDNTQFYNGSGTGNVPNTSDDCYKLLVKNTATGALPLTENANVREVEVESGGNLVVNTGTRLQVTNGINNNGDIRLLGTSQILQTHTGTKQVTGTGKLYKDQEGTTTTVYQSAYWSSPVTTNGTNFTISGILKDGTSATSINSTPPNINFTDIHTLNGAKSNPITISGRWLAKLINDVDWTRQINPTTELLNPGEGWNMKSTGGGTQNFTFVGIPNDGTYTTSINQNRLSLIGNPYPSALDGDLFSTNNASAITGVLYFYDATNDTTHIRGAYTGGYATRAVGVGTPFSGGSTPGKYIPIGQAFFVTRDATGTGTITFQNSQRAFVPRGATSSFFSRTVKDNTVKKEANSSLPILRIGFEFYIDNTQKYHRQLAVGFRGLTNNYEAGFDAEMFDRQPSDIALKIADKTTPFVISGIQNFSKDIEIPLAVYLDKQRNITFKIDGVENIAIDNIYLKDAVTSQYYNLTGNNTSVPLYLSAGNYEDRFFITFNNASVLNTEGIDIVSKNIVTHINKLTKELVVIEKGDIKVLEIKLVTLLGQEIRYWKKKTNNKEVKWRLPSISPSVYILKINTSKGTLTKKIITE